MAGNVFRRGIHVVHDGNGENIIEKFCIKIPFARGRAFDDRRRAGVQPEFHGTFPRRFTRIYQALFQSRQKSIRNRAVHQTDLCGIADGGPAGLCVLHDVERFFRIGALVHINVTNARAGLDTGYRGVLDAGADQSCPAPRNQEIDQSPRRHQLFRAVARSVLHDIDELFGKSAGAQGTAHHFHDSQGRGERFFPPAQDADVSAFETERRCIGSDVGPAFIDDRHRAEGHGNPLDLQAVGPRYAIEYPADGIFQRRDRAHPFRHGHNPGFRKRKPIDHDLRNLSLCPLHICTVGFQNALRALEKRVGHCRKRAVFLFGSKRRRPATDGARFPQDVYRHFHCFFLPTNLVPNARPSVIL